MTAQTKNNILAALVVTSGVFAANTAVTHYGTPHQKEVVVAMERIEEQLAQCKIESDPNKTVQQIQRLKQDWAMQKDLWTEASLSFASAAHEISWNVRMKRLDVAFIFAELGVYDDRHHALLLHS